LDGPGEGEDELMTENRRRALAESYFELGETSKAETLYGDWLHADPGWGRKDEASELRKVAKRSVTATKVTRQKIWRNEPCPCGSGKKFKKCRGA
jgi:uncharacterized protein YecA (UPF0149 family)